MPAECERRNQPQDQRRNHRQKPVDQHRRDDTGVAAAEADQCAGQAELDDANPSGGDRDRGENADERPGRERLDDGNL